MKLGVLLVIALAAIAVGSRGSDPAEPARAASASPPLTFVENRGQVDRRVRFHVQGPRHAFYLTRDAIALSLQRESGRGVALWLRFLGGNARAVVGRERAAGTVNFLRGGEARTRVPAYHQVAYRDLWPGIDLVLRGRDGELKYEFRVRPGARPADIRLAYGGARGLRHGPAGSLQIETAIGALRDSAPVAYQQRGDDRVAVASRYALDGRNYGFDVASYDRRRELVIDPGLAYSTLLGGNSHEMGIDIAADVAGNAYVTGFTQSPNFPTTAGAFDRTGAAGNNLDVFVTKLNPAGTALVYSTFIGGSNFDWGRGLAIDSAGNAYVTGQTKSSNFPTTGGAFDRSFNVDNCPRCGIDQYDAFVAKLNPSGSGLVYSTFLGGTQPDDSLGIAIDGARNAYVTGQTVSGNFPVTGGAFDRTANGEYDAFVTKLNAAGSALVYSTRLGGADNELPEDVAVDSAGNAYVGGGTRSDGFPTTPGAFDTTHNGGAFDERFDLFVTKLNAAGSALVYSTFLGGSKSDFSSDFALDSAGNAYLTGATLSPDFPTTPGAVDSAFDSSEGVAAKLDTTGSRLVYSTFLGDVGATGIVPDAGGSAWLAGGSGGDAYVARLNPAGSVLDQEIRFGGADTDVADDITLDGAGIPYVTGHTYSADFPTTPGAFDRTFAGDTTIFWGDAFVAKLDVNGTPPPPPPPPPPPLAAPTLVSPADSAAVGQPVTFDWTGVPGAASYTIQVDEVSDFGEPLILSAGATDSQFTTASLPESPWFWFWRVRAVSAEGTAGTWSEVRMIDVQSAPPPPPLSAPTQLSPANDARFPPGQSITFDWSDVAGAPAYTIQIDDSQSFSAPQLVNHAASESRYTTSTLPTTRMWWRVRAGDGPWSGARRFEVKD